MLSNTPLPSAAVALFPLLLLCGLAAGCIVGPFSYNPLSEPPAVVPLGDDTEPVSAVADFEPQREIWLTWRDTGCFAGPPIGDTVLDVAAALVPHVAVRFHVADEAAAERLAARLAERGLDTERVRTFVYPDPTGTIRDYGPAFVRLAGGGLGVVDFRWNDDGGTSDAAETVDRAWAAELGLPVVGGSELVSMGGGREVDGRGTLLVAEAAELASNAGWTHDDVAAEYRRHLGVTNVVWLGAGTPEDGPPAAGHVHNVARFAGPSTILFAARESLHAEDNLRRLQAARDADGEPFEILRVPAAGYLDYAIADGVVVLPRLGRPDGPESIRAADEEALAVFHRAFPDREVVPVEMSALALCGGGFHRLSLNVPAGG